MTAATYLDCGVRPALRLLPPAMDTAEARALIVAIALQETRLTSRRQIHGTARGYAQFEMGPKQAIPGVLAHHATADFAKAFCRALDIRPTPEWVYAAIEYNDVLNAGFSRLLLWTLPHALPGPERPRDGWYCYVDAWRPGTPHPETWNALYALAWETVLGHPIPKEEVV